MVRRFLRQIASQAAATGPGAAMAEVLGMAPVWCGPTRVRIPYPEVAAELAQASPTEAGRPPSESPVPGAPLCWKRLQPDTSHSEPWFEPIPVFYA